MAKDSSKIVKICGKKKINRYDKATCTGELARLDGVKDTGSEYRRRVESRLKELA